MNTVTNFRTPRSILVLTDFSNSAKNAADYATNLAQHVNANVVLLNAYAIPDVGFDSWPIEEEPKYSEESLAKLAEETARLHDIVENQPGVIKPKIESISLEGSIAQNVTTIINEKQDILMVVMGGYKGNGKDDMYFGEEITKILCNVKCPTLIVPEMDYLPI